MDVFSQQRYNNVLTQYQQANRPTLYNCSCICVCCCISDNTKSNKKKSDQLNIIYTHIIKMIQANSDYCLGYRVYVTWHAEDHIQVFYIGFVTDDIIQTLSVTRQEHTCTFNQQHLLTT
jgi:hypothetical protein